MDSCNCSISDFKMSVFPTVYLLIFVLGIVGHLISMYVFLNVCCKKSLTTVNLFMVNLLVSDLMLICSLPFRASYYILGSSWKFGSFGCSFIFYVFYLNMYTSVFFLVSLNIMRYLALMHPYRYLRLQKYCNGWAVCLCIWVFVALACSPLLNVRSINPANDFKCLELPSNVTAIDKLININYGTLIFFALPLVIILLCSVLVACKLLKLGPSKHTINTTTKKAFALVVISLGFFLICFLPYHIVRGIFLHKEREMRLNCPNSCDSIKLVRKAAVVTLCLCLAHSCLDPILFFFVGENFRTFFARRQQRKTLSLGNYNERQQRAELKTLQK